MVRAASLRPGAVDTADSLAVIGGITPVDAQLARRLTINVDYRA